MPLALLALWRSSASRITKSMIRRFFVLTMTVAVLLSISTAPAVAQDTDLPDPDELQTTTASDPAHQRIDANTQLVEARLDDGNAVLVIKSSETQRLTITDAGAMMAGGNIPRKKYIVKGGEKTTIRMDVHTDGGFAGVTIDTGETLWGVPLKDSYEFLPGGPRTQDVQVAGLTGIVFTGLLALLVAFRRRSGATSEKERIA